MFVIYTAARIFNQLFSAAGIDCREKIIEKFAHCSIHNCLFLVKFRISSEQAGEQDDELNSGLSQ